MRSGTEQLQSAGIEDAGTDAWLLLSEVFGMSRARYFMDMNQHCDPELTERYFSLIDRRCERIPLQHILGKAPFMEYEFEVNEHVLTPRADTEVLVEEAFSQIRKLWRDRLADEGKGTLSKIGHTGEGLTANACAEDQRNGQDETNEVSGSGQRDGGYSGKSLQILDMCTGSGCIAISLAAMAKEAGIACQVTAVDLSEEALAVAGSNNDRICNGSVDFICSNLFEALPEDRQFDIIVSNPPYIRSDEIEGLMPEVRDHEPRMALDGMGDGLFFYREIIKNSRSYLKKDGMLLFEIGYDQGISVPEIMKSQGFTEVAVIQDLAGLDRVVTGKFC